MHKNTNQAGRSQADGLIGLPQRGYGLQPRVAAWATLGTNKKRNFNRNAVASCSQREMYKADPAALRLRTRSLSLPRVAEAATLGWRPMPRWGTTENYCSRQGELRLLRQSRLNQYRRLVVGRTLKARVIVVFEYDWRFATKYYVSKY